MENLDNFAFYAQPKIEAIVDGDRYPYQSISGALGSLLLPNETRESFIVFQVVDTATDVSFEVGDTYSGKGAMKPIWTVDVELSK